MQKKYVVVRKTAKKGRGVFTLRSFKEREFIMKVRGKVIKREDMVNLSRYLRFHLDTVGKDKYIKMGYPERYINHSCSPNVFEQDGKIFAMRSIKENEELGFDYSICSIDDWTMKCCCRSKNCRKVIRGDFFKLPIELQIRYAPYLDSWFKKEFKNRIISGGFY